MKEVFDGLRKGFWVEQVFNRSNFSNALALGGFQVIQVDLFLDALTFMV